jgi:hypothetical protein
VCRQAYNVSKELAVSLIITLKMETAGSFEVMLSTGVHGFMTWKVFVSPPSVLVSHMTGSYASR